MLPWVQLLWDSELPGLPGSLFPSPDWGSSTLCFQIIFNFLLFLFPFWHPYHLDVGTFGDVPEGPYTILIFVFFLILVSSFCSWWTFISSLCSKYTPPLMVPCRFFFISLRVNFISSFMLLLYSVSSLSILILWASLSDAVFWTLHLIGWLFLFHIVIFLGGLFCSFIWTVFLVSLIYLCLFLCIRERCFDSL